MRRHPRALTGSVRPVRRARTAGTDRGYRAVCVGPLSRYLSRIRQFRAGQSRTGSAVRGKILAVSRSIDLFDDAPWSTEVPVDHGTVRSPRSLLVVSLASVVLLMASLAIPWFKSGETPAWTPFSNWLNLGWAPGTKNWGFLVLALAAVVAISIGLVIPSARNTWTGLVFLAATAMVVVTLLEATAQLSVNPGPELHADYGAWIGSAAAVLAWIGIAVVTGLSLRRSSTSRPQ